jgi:hypothetical protein
MAPKRAAIILQTCAVFAHPLCAQSDNIHPVQRPKSADRVVHLFDFEEPDNPLPVPLNWIRAQHDPLVPRDRPGFPIWNVGAFDHDIARSGTSSVRLPVRGGSASLLLRPGALSIMPGADYRLTGWIRTDHLERASACISARLLDQEGTLVPGSEVRTRLVASTDLWTLVDLVIVGRDAAYLQIELQVLQPEHYQKRTFNFDQLIVLEDVQGAAWFDDIMIVQMPRIDLATNAPSQVIAHPQQPSVHVELRDLTGDELSIRLRAFDADNQLIDHITYPFESGRSARHWQPALEHLGWYRVVVEVADREQRVVGTDSIDFVWVLGHSAISGTSAQPQSEDSKPRPASSGSRDRARFGIAVNNISESTFERVADAASLSGSGGVTVPVWTGDAEVDASLHIDFLLSIVRRLRDDWMQVTLAVDTIPAQLAESFQIDRTEVVALFARPATDWSPILEPILDRLGPFVHQWQIGAFHIEQHVERSDFASLLTTIEGEFRRLVPESELSIPWPAEVAERPNELTSQRRRTMLVTRDLSNESIRDLRSVFGRPQPQDTDERAISAVLEGTDPTLFGVRHAADDFARRAIEAWAAIGPKHGSSDRRGGSLTLVEPWHWSNHRRPRLTPNVELAVWRNLVERLADRAASADLELAPGVRAVLFEPREQTVAERGSTLAIWAEPHAQAASAIELLLGRGTLSLADIFGNESVLSPTETTDLGLVYHRVEVTSSPVFIDGVDANLIRFLSSLALDPPFISARNGEHEHTITLHNPWRVPIRGELYIIEPGGYGSPDGIIDRSWRILPRVMPFSLEPDEVAQLPITISFSPFEESGPREFVFDFELVTEDEYGLIRLARHFEIGVPELRMQTTYRLGPEPDGPHIFVDVDVINTGPEQVSFRLSSQAPGYPRESASVAHLAPGRSSRRTFVLPNGAQALKGSRVATSLAIPEDGTRLNQSMLIE